MSLPSWRDTATRRRIVEFVGAAVAGIPPEERIAVFDNDGTLCCEKPLPAQADFLLRRVGSPKAPVSEVITRHYRGDDTELHALAAGLLHAYEGTSVDEFAVLAREFLVNELHPTLGRPYVRTAFRPMTELLRYLAANGFTCYIATGTGRDFLRTISQDVYGIPPERVIGSSAALEYRDGRIVHTAELDLFDDGPAKPVRIWSRIGRHPILAAGNANGDLPMLHAASSGGHTPLRLLILHDDADREFAYTAGADEAITTAKAEDWLTVSMSRDWSKIFD